MKTILCYGDSNTWGSSPSDNGRYGLDVRWGSVLRTTLGEGYWVIEEGLGGRTTVHPDPVEGENRSGKMYLPACLESHVPIDLVAMLLGTNDMKHRFNLTAWDVAAGAGTLVDIIQKSDPGPTGAGPKVLLICPPPFGKLSPIFSEMFAGSIEISWQLPAHYRAVAKQYGCEFLDAGQIIIPSDVDGIHFDASEHQKLGKAVAANVKAILE